MSLTVEYKLLVLAAMLFCHIADDYYLQGVLSTLKQSSWWAQNAPDKLYSNDYIVALFEHAFSWAFVSTLPLLVVVLLAGSGLGLKLVLLLYVANTVIHGVVDDLKANARKINLCTDQAIHIVQLVVSWFVVMTAIGA